MNQEQITEKLSTAMNGKTYDGELTKYAVKSIESGRSNYPVSNLITYCNDSGVKLKMIDMATEDSFYPTSVMDIHKIFDLLMKRYKIENKTIYLKSSVHYTSPKSFDNDEKALLSINTFIAVCNVIHCDLFFESN